MFDERPVGVDQLLAEADARLALRNFAAALELAHQVLAIDPHQPRALLTAALSCNELGRHKEAVSFCQMGLAVQPQSVYALTVASLCYCGARMMPAALDLAQRVVQLAPASGIGYRLCVLPYLRLGQRGPALQAAKEGVRLDPALVDSHVQLSAALLANFRFRAAIKAGEQALELDPRSRQAANVLGVAYMRGGHLMKAYRMLRLAVALDPTAELPKRNLRHLLIGPRRVIIVLLLSPLWGSGLVLALLWPAALANVVPSWVGLTLLVAWWVLIVAGLIVARRRLRVDPIIRSLWRDYRSRRRAKRQRKRSFRGNSSP